MPAISANLPAFAGALKCQSFQQPCPCACPGAQKCQPFQHAWLSACPGAEKCQPFKPPSPAAEEL